MTDEHKKLLVAMNKCVSAQLDLAEIAHQLSRLLDTERTGYWLSCAEFEVLRMDAVTAMNRAEELRDFFNERICKKQDEFREQDQ